MNGNDAQLTEEDAVRIQQVDLQTATIDTPETGDQAINAKLRPMNREVVTVHGDGMGIFFYIQRQEVFKKRASGTDQ